MPAYNGRTIVLRRSWHIGLANAGYSVAWCDRCDFKPRPPPPPPPRRLFVSLSLSLFLIISERKREYGKSEGDGGGVNDLWLILSIIR